MAPFKNVLAATDFSKNCEKVVEFAKDVANLSGAALHVVHVVDTPEFPITLANYDEFSRMLRERADTEMAKIKQNLEGEHITVNAQVLNGSPAHELLEYIEKQHIDLTCVGVHAHSKLENFLFGSTAERVLRQAPCPVLAVRI